jgi:hypothetical protein
MPVTITGQKYTGSLTAVGTTTLTNSGASFSSGDFTVRRLVGLWSSGGTFKGFSFIRRWISGTQVELTYQFVSSTGTTVTQASGDVYRISKNYAESVTTGIAVSGGSVTLTDRPAFGTAGDSGSVCFYDESKNILVASSATSGGAEPAFNALGGLVVHGYLEDFASRRVSGGCKILIQNTISGNNGTGGIACSSTSAKIAFFGGSVISESAPTYIGDWYNGSFQGMAGEFQFYWGIETNCDLLQPTRATNSALQQVVNVSSTVKGNFAIALRWGNSYIEGGSYNIFGGLPLSVFGAADEANGQTYNIGAPPGSYLIINDVGVGGRPALWSNFNQVTQTLNFTNLVTPNRKLGWNMGGIGGSAWLPGTVPNNNATGYFRFSGTFSGLLSGSLAIIKNNSVASTIADFATVSGTSQTLTVLERTVVGHTETVNENSWLWAFLLYGYQILSGSVATQTVDFGPAGTAPKVSFGSPVGQVLDSSISQAAAATVAAYTGFLNFDWVYDYPQYFKALNTTNALIPTLTQKLIDSNSGTLFTPVAYNIVIDTAAGSIFLVSTGTTTLTLKPLSSAISSGTKHTALQISSGKSLTFAQNGDKTSGKYICGTGVTIVVASGTTNLRGSTLAGCTINTATTATVLVDSVTGITTGTGVTLQEPQPSIRLFGLPTVANTVLRVKDLTSNAITNPTPVAGEVTIIVNPARSYEIRADAPGYLMQRITLSGATPEFAFSLQDFRALYNSGVNRSSQITFNYSTQVVTISDSATTISFADMFRTVEDYLATVNGLELDAQPYPVTLPDRNILWFPKTPGGAVNPVRVKPNPANTTDPALLFETYLDGASDTSYGLFDFSAAGGRIIRVRSVVAIAQGATQQEIRNAFTLPATRTPDTGSIDQKLNTAAKNGLVMR